MSTVDTMAIAVDWLDAYRAKALESLIALYDESATHSCICDGLKLVAGELALRAYWLDRFERHPAFALVDLRPEADGILVSYATTSSVVQARLTFDKRGKIVDVVCGPEIAETRPLKLQGCMRGAS